MTEPETEKQILAKINELLQVVDQQGKKIDEIAKRLEKFEKAQSTNKQGKHECEGDCFSIPEECIPALMNPDKYKPQPGEKYLKESKIQSQYKKSFWKKFE